MTICGYMNFKYAKEVSAVHRTAAREQKIKLSKFPSCHSQLLMPNMYQSSKFFAVFGVLMANIPFH